MYNIDPLTAEDMNQMKRYIGKLYFRKSENNNQVKVYLKSFYDGEAVIYRINLHEIKTIFSEELFKIAQEEPILLDFYANVSDDGELFDFKALTVYDYYSPRI